MKANFILRFIDELTAAGTDFFQAWASTSYKGFRMRDKYPRSFKIGVASLEHRKLLLRSKNGLYRFSENGRYWLKRTLIKYHRSIGTKWDGKWRIVMFDIPHRYERQRHVFRVKLKEMGFQMLQKSVFVIPYPCEEELSRVCQYLKLNDYVEMLIAETIGSKEDELKKLFVL